MLQKANEPLLCQVAQNFVKWQEIDGAAGYQIRKWAGTNSYTNFASSGFAEFTDHLGDSNAVYRYDVCAIAARHGLTNAIRVQPLQWTWTNSSPDLVVFRVERQCSSDWIPIAETTYLRYVDVQTECISDGAQYRVVPIVNQTAGQPLVPSTIVSGESNLELPPPAANVFHVNTSSNIQDGTIDIRLLEFEAATNAAAALHFTTPTNLSLRASVAYVTTDNAASLERVELYANGELMTVFLGVPYAYEWGNPAGLIDGKVYKFVLRAVDSLGRIKDSDVYYAKVYNKPALNAYTTSATDLQVSTPGVPLSFSRSYNSQDLSPGLLGKGWKTAWDSARVVVPDLATNWTAKKQILSTHPFDLQEKTPHRVQVTLPGGGTEYFHMTPVPSADPGDSVGGLMGFAGVSLNWLLDDEQDGNFELPFAFYPEAGAAGQLEDKVGALTLKVGAEDVVNGPGNSEQVNILAADGAVYSPNGFRYTGSDGSVYEYGQAMSVTGSSSDRQMCLLSITDRNGNKVTFNSTITNDVRVLTSVTHSDGRSISVAVEPVASNTNNYYVKLYDPLSPLTNGVAVVRYKVEGGLLTEVARLTNRGLAQYETNRYEYWTGTASTNVNGLLKRIISPEGVILLENDYFGSVAGDFPQFAAYDGFLKAQVDAVGVTANLAHDPDEGTGDIASSVTQSIPGSGTTATSEALFDSAGRPVSVVDETGRPSGMGYDAQGHVAYTQNASGDFKFYEYDDKDRPVAVTDELGNQTKVVYDALDQPLSTTDAKGNTTKYVYYQYPNGHSAADNNPEGSLKSVTDASGIETSYTYNNRGQVLTETRVLPITGEKFTTSYEYYATNETGGSLGDLKCVKEPLWPGHVTNSTSKLYTTEYTYDANGNRLTEKRYREVVARGSTGTVTDYAALQTVTTTYAYDAQNRLTNTVVTAATGENTAETIQTSVSVYNSAGKVASTTDHYHRQTFMTYDVRGNLIQTSYPDQTVSRTVYDGKGRAIWQQERTTVSSGQSTAAATFTQYDASGRVLAVKRYANVVLEQGMATATETVTDSTTQFRRKSGDSGVSQATMKFVSAPTNAVSVTRTEYDLGGRVQYSMDTRGIVTEYEYDDAGRRTNVLVYTTPISIDATNLTPSGSYTSTSSGYDANGNQAWTEDALHHRTEFFYDSLNRCTITRFPQLDGETNRKLKTTTYDALGRRVRETDEAGVITAFGYDALGRLTSVTNDWRTGYNANETPIATTYSYDAFGNEIAQTDANGNTTRFEYDALGRRVYRILPGGVLTDDAANTNLERVVYNTITTNGIGLMAKVVKDFRGRTTTFSYDILDRLVASIPSNTYTATNGDAIAVDQIERTRVDYHYTTNGQRAEVIQSGGTSRTVRYAYDELNRLRVKDSPEGTLTYEYDATGALSKISARWTYSGWLTTTPTPFSNLSVSATDTNRAEWNYSYDTLGRLQTVNADGSTADARYTYTAVGNLNTTTYRNGLVTTYTYNNRNWLRNLRTVTGTNLVALFDYDNADLAAQFRLSATGQRQSAQESYGAIGRTVTYAYDRLSRLVTENITDTNSTSPAGMIYYGTTNVYSTTEGYDLVGNRRSRQVTGDVLTKVPSSNYEYNARDFVLNGGFAYDSSGNTTQDANTAVYTYDNENRLVKRSGGGMSEVTIIYDADGNRVGKTVVTNSVTNTVVYLVEDRNPTGYAQVMEEWTSTDSAAATLSCSYVYGLDLISQSRGTNISYFGYDGLGSTRYLTDINGATTDTYTYDAFGILIASSGSTLNNFRYTGEQWDPDLGMYYLRARYYKPELGRFWTMDSYEGSASDPLSLHKYLYCHGNALNRVDPTGHYEGVVGAVVGFAMRAGMWAASASPYAIALRYAISTLNVIAFVSDPGMYVSMGPAGAPDILAADFVSLMRAGSQMFRATRSAILAHDAFKTLAGWRTDLKIPPVGTPEGDAVTTALLEIQDQFWIGSRFKGRSPNDPSGMHPALNPNAITRQHAEADAFNQAAWAGSTAERALLTVDRELCGACGTRGGVKSMAKALGIKELTIVTPSGKTVVTIDATISAATGFISPFGLISLLLSENDAP